MFDINWNQPQDRWIDICHRISILYKKSLYYEDMNSEQKRQLIYLLKVIELKIEKYESEYRVENDYDEYVDILNSINNIIYD